MIKHCKLNNNLDKKKNVTLPSVAKHFQCIKINFDVTIDACT